LSIPFLKKIKKVFLGIKTRNTLSQTVVLRKNPKALEIKYQTQDF
jgi:hypothetical protein